MTRTANQQARSAQVDQLKRIIAQTKDSNQESLEAAVDAFLWSEQDRRQFESAEQTVETRQTRAS